MLENVSIFFRMRPTASKSCVGTLENPISSNSRTTRTVLSVTTGSRASTESSSITLASSGNTMENRYRISCGRCAIKCVSFYCRRRIVTVELRLTLKSQKHHYQDLPDNVKRHLGPLPDGFLSYFTRRFPNLFKHVHSVVSRTNLRYESMFKSYFELPD